MRVYNNGANVDQMLRDTVVDAMGCSGVLIQNGQVTDESYRQHIPDAEKQTSRVCIGQNLATREVIILTVGNENDVNRKGLTSMACAQILRQYGCDIAVELCEGVGSGAMDKGSLMYVPDDGNEPTAYAYWFISRKCFYKSDYERELAELVQNYGACIWQGFLNKKAIAKVKVELDEEIQRAQDAEKNLQENIDKETERATGEEQRIEAKVDAETERATEAERVLQENIDKETQRATGEEQRIEGRLNDEIQRATGEEQRIEGKLDAEIQRSTAEDKRIDAKLDVEIQRAKDAEKVLTDNLDKEVHRAMDEEGKLHGEIETERGERKAEDLAIRGALNDVNADLTGKINSESQARIAADAALDTKLSARIDTWEKEVTKLQGLMTTLQNQMTSLDTTVTTMLHTVSDIEVALNNVKTSIADIISGKTILPYVRLAGDTMTGVLNMGGNEITGLPGLQFVNGSHFDEADGKLQAVNGNDGVRVSGADAVDDNDFVTKKQLNDKTIPVATDTVVGGLLSGGNLYVMAGGKTKLTVNGAGGTDTSNNWVNTALPAVSLTYQNTSAREIKVGRKKSFARSCRLAVMFGTEKETDGRVTIPTIVKINEADLPTDGSDFRYPVNQVLLDSLPSTPGAWTPTYTVIETGYNIVARRLLDDDEWFISLDIINRSAGWPPSPFINVIFLDGYMNVQMKGYLA